jgi:pullulanase
MAAAAVFFAMGIPFIQAGQEFLRSKPFPGGNSFDHNSYNSPDIVNSLKWGRKSEYRDVFDYYKGLIEFRKNHSALRFSSGEKVSEHLTFFDNLPQRIVGYRLTGDDKLSEILVFFNPGEFPVKLFAFDEYDVYINAKTAGDTSIAKISGEYTVDGLSVIVLGKPYTDEQFSHE